MVDSANVLSILASLNPTPAATPPAAPVDASQAYYPPQPTAAPVAPAPAAAPPAASVDPNVLQALSMTAPDPNPTPPPTPVPPSPYRRGSLLDVIGRLGDAFARAGNAPAQYQPYMDALQDRDLAMQDHSRKVDMDNLSEQAARDAHTTVQATAVADQRKRMGVALSALDGNPNAATLWPSIAAQAGIAPQQAAAIGTILQKNPDAAGVFAKSLGADPDNLGKNVYFGTDAQGNTVAYQVGADGNPHMLDFSGAGVTPNAPIKIVDTGNGNAIVEGSTVKKILPKFARPDTVLTTGVSTANNVRDNQTKLTIAGMPARGKPGAANGAASSPFTAFSNGVSSLRSLDQSLDELTRDPNLSGATGLIGGHLNITDGQRTIKGKIDTLAGQAIPAAISAIKASGGASPRSVAEIMGEVKGLTGAIQNRDMPTAAYVANINAARARLRARIQDLTDDALRQGFAVRGKNGQIMPAPAAPAAAPKTVLPRSANGWSIVGVK